MYVSGVSSEEVINHDLVRPLGGVVAVPEHVLGGVRAGTAADVAQWAHRQADVAAAGVLTVLEPERLVALDHVGDN